MVAGGGPADADVRIIILTPPTKFAATSAVDATPDNPLQSLPNAMREADAALAAEVIGRPAI
jgi:hypothetical protein